jgi:hypothetical protein
MNARMLLFADFGKGPKCRRVLSVMEADEARNGRKTLRSVFGARRWWLVECESAAAGREIIAQSHMPADKAYATGNLGRILDSGTNLPKGRRI